MTDYRGLFEATLHGGPTLSAKGTLRRATMREQLAGMMVRRRERARAVRRAGAATLGALACLALWHVLRPPPQPPAAPLALQLVHARLEVVHDRGDLLAESMVATRPVPREMLIDDSELLRLLDEAQRPTGLIRTARGVMLTAQVTDPFER